MERIYLSEQLGYDVFLTAEGRGSECFIPLGYVAARTKVIDLGSRRSTT
jgi:alkanesulfonate monooxygenase SsuD/methylene tetrahydromethanopterin reductase-like flavin-dependent oxidoreductase (luciferase family)